MTSDLFETSIHSDLIWMTPIIDTWRENIRSYIDAHKNLYGYIDPPYSSTERANISLLAGAAWQQKDGVALEEYTVEKKYSGKTSWGRADIWIAFGEKTLSVEAKQVWQTGGVNKGLEGAWQKAICDAQKIEGESDQCMALIFVTVKIKPYELKNKNINTIIKERVAIGKDIENIDFYASYFPIETRYLKFPDTGGGEWIWPGVYMLGRLL
ncbi:hypothetical protein [Ferruginivarius sediminum]|uniref:hypothetical protein n=1 Tax=Ferruginivarius sediminum TaxID=2661937 RepID=UPI0011C05615|nr:hypothetical protein [Ferruginivarius sediminum]